MGISIRAHNVKTSVDKPYSTLEDLVPVGEVYLAQHPRLPRRDALKLLPPGWSVDEDYRARFIRPFSTTHPLGATP